MEHNENKWLLFCRLCAENDNFTNHVNLLSNGELIEIIEKHFFLKISEDDVLPKKLCASCYKFIMAVSKFYHRVINAQEILHKIVDNALDESQELMNEDNVVEESLPSPHEVEINFHSSIEDLTMEQDKEDEVTYQISDVSEAFDENMDTKIDENENNNNRAISTQQKTNPVIFDKILQEDLYLNPYNMIIRIDLKVNMTCSHCNEELPYLFSYMDHKAAVHRSIGLDDIFLCPLCRRQHSTLRQFKLHLITHHMPDIPIPMKCEMCKIELESFLCYWEHLNFKHSINITQNRNEKNKKYDRKNNNWKCPFCNKYFTSYSPFKYHIGLTHTYWTEMNKGSYSMAMVDRVDASVLSKCPELSWVSQIIGREENTVGDDCLKKEPEIEMACENTKLKEIKEIRDVKMETEINSQLITINTIEGCDNPKCLAAVNTAVNQKSKAHVNFQMDIKCKNCDEPFNRISSYLQHLTTIHSDLNSTNKWRCPLCGKLFSSNVDLKEHFLSCHIQDIYMELKCQQCSKKVLSVKSLGEHLEKEHSNQWKCPICQGNVVDKSKLKPHIGLMHVDWLCKEYDADYSMQDLQVNLTCLECSKNFVTFFAYRNHMKLQHMNITKTLQWLCPICKDVANLNSYSLKSHLKSSHVECCSNIMNNNTEINKKSNSDDSTEVKKFPAKDDDKMDSHTKRRKTDSDMEKSTTDAQEYKDNKAKINNSPVVNEGIDPAISVNKDKEVINDKANSLNTSDSVLSCKSENKFTMETESKEIKSKSYVKDSTNSNDTVSLRTGIIKEVIDFQIPLTCQRCHKYMEYTSQFMEHTYREHADIKFEERWHCPICDIKPRRKSKFKLHMLHNHIHDIPMTLPCDECNIKFKSFNLYMEHIYCEHKKKNERDWKCPLCHRLMKYVSQLKTHLGTFHVIWLAQTIEMTTSDISDVKVFKCGLCKETQNTYEEFCHHLKMKHFMSVLRPNQTSQAQNSDNSDIQMNVKSRLEDDARAKKAIKANIRRKLKEKIIGMRRMERNRSSEMILTCQYCQETLRSFNQYRDHIKLYHINYAFRNNWCCPICGLIKQYSSQLLQHLKNHLSDDNNDDNEDDSTGPISSMDNDNDSEAKINNHDNNKEDGIRPLSRMDIDNNSMSKELPEDDDDDDHDKNDSMSSISMIDNSTNMEIYNVQVDSSTQNDNDDNGSDDNYESDLVLINTNDGDNSSTEVVKEQPEVQHHDEDGGLNDTILIDLNNSSTSIEIFNEQAEIIVENDDDTGDDENFDDSNDIENSHYTDVDNINSNQTITIVSISFLCEICKDTFQNNDMLQIHMKEHEENNQSQKGGHIENFDDIEIHLQCKKCVVQCETFSEYCCHMKINHRQETGRLLWCCPLCEQRKFDKFKLRNHLLHHKELSKDIILPFTCKVCNEELSSYLTYSEHMEVKHQKGQFHDKWQCPKCSRSITKLRFRRHFVMYHLPPEAKDLYRCPICKITFLCESSLQQHIKKHKVVRKVEQTKTACPYCGKFYLFRNLETHLKLKHIRKRKIKQKSRKFICEECGECVSSRYILNSHKERHAGIASHECEICSKRFTNVRQLKRHLETHENRKYMCTICGAQLSTRAVLNTHLWLHRIKKTQKCEMCDRAFKTRSELKKHMESHSGLKRTRRKKSPLTLVRMIAEELQEQIVVDDIEMLPSTEETNPEDS